MSDIQTKDINIIYYIHEFKNIYELFLTKILLDASQNIRLKNEGTFCASKELNVFTRTKRIHYTAC